ncbi:MAG: SdiA-regulated domain-containing protein, partial [Bacteroidota bacterium]
MNHKPEKILHGHFPAMFSGLRWLITMVLMVAACSSAFSQQQRFPYDIDNPSEKHILPTILEEISGNSLLNDHIMICVQDEKGDLFFYNLEERRLIKRVDFGKDADYEDVTLIGDEAWVLRSNGTLYRIRYFDDEDRIETREIKTALSGKNNCEGLCYDPVENRLLIALKGKPEINDEQDFDGYKAIYAFDPETEKLSEEPAYLIELKQIKDLENASLYEQISHKIAATLEESDDIRFQPSAVCVHPETDDIYVLA